MGVFFETKNLCYCYIKKPLCLKDVSFSARKNDFVLILAPDEMGKTTLINCLSGFDDKYFGSVLFEGKEVKKIPDEKKRFSIIYDNPVVLNASIDKNINFVYRAINENVPDDNKKIQMLEKFGLKYNLKTHMKKLSVFEKIKFCLLRAYVKNSRVVFIDDILKSEFSAENIEELEKIFDDYLKGKLVFFTAGNQAFKRYKKFFEKMATKVLYLNNAEINEIKSVDNFEMVDLDMLKFVDGFKQIEGVCYRNGDEYTFEFEDKILIKIDDLNKSSLQKLKLNDGENEEIVLAFDETLSVDLTKNNDVLKLLKNKKIMVFSKLDRARVI